MREFTDQELIRREKAEKLKPSARGELEITDINLEYLHENRLRAIRMCRGTAWIDAGTPDSLIDAALFVQMIEKRQGLKLSCIEELALNLGFISLDQFEKLILPFPDSSDYKKYLQRILLEKKRA